VLVATAREGDLPNSGHAILLQDGRALARWRDLAGRNAFIRAAGYLPSLVLPLRGKHGCIDLPCFGIRPRDKPSAALPEILRTIGPGDHKKRTDKVHGTERTVFGRFQTFSENLRSSPLCRRTQDQMMPSSEDNTLSRARLFQRGETTDTAVDARPGCVSSPTLSKRVSVGPPQRPPTFSVVMVGLMGTPSLSRMSAFSWLSLAYFCVCFLSSVAPPDTKGMGVNQTRTGWVSGMVRWLVLPGQDP